VSRCAFGAASGAAVIPSAPARGDTAQHRSRAARVESVSPRLSRVTSWSYGRSQKSEIRVIAGESRKERLSVEQQVTVHTTSFSRPRDFAHPDVETVILLLVQVQLLLRAADPRAMGCIAIGNRDSLFSRL
jgi:hypothetical protein